MSDLDKFGKGKPMAKGLDQQGDNAQEQSGGQQQESEFRQMLGALDKLSGADKKRLQDARDEERRLKPREIKE